MSSDVLCGEAYRVVVRVGNGWPLTLEAEVTGRASRAFTPLASSRWRMVRVAYGLLFAVSAVSACQGARHPWRYSPPVAHLTRDPATGAIGWWWNRFAVTDTLRGASRSR